MPFRSSPARSRAGEPASDPVGSSPIAGVTIGVTGGTVRAEVAPSGVVRLADGGPALAWHVAADDRWHDPTDDPTLRQRRIGGCPVVETRMRIPGGDAVHRAWAVADRGGVVVVEVENDSPLPFAVAFSGAPLLTPRPPSDVPVQGIELPADAVVLPVGHRASVRVALTSEGATGMLPPVPDSAAVVRGWSALAARGSRLELPDPSLADEVTAARCDLVLAGPVEPRSDPAGFLLDVAELVRLGDDADAWMPEIVGPAETIARRRVGETGVALAAAAQIALAAGDRRAGADIERLRAADGSGPAPSLADLPALAAAASRGRFVRAVERLFAAGGALLPSGIPAPWLGQDWAAHGIPTEVGSTVSFALRWHGERPAVLWEQDGPAITLRAPLLAPTWSSAEPTGETLWPPPSA